MSIFITSDNEREAAADEYKREAMHTSEGRAYCNRCGLYRKLSFRTLLCNACEADIKREIADEDDDDGGESAAIEAQERGIYEAETNYGDGDVRYGPPGSWW